MPEPSTIPTHQPLGVGDLYRLFYARVDGEGFHRGDFEAAIENWNRPGRVSSRGVTPHEQGGIAGYYANVVVLEPGTATELFVNYIVTSEHGQPGFGEFRRVETKLVGHGGKLYGDIVGAWEAAYGWVTTGGARDAVVGAVEDVGRSAGRVIGSTSGGFAESFGPLRAGALVLGAAAVGAWVVSRKL